MPACCMPGDAYSLAHESLLDLGRHARVHLDSDALLDLLENADRQVTGSGTNLKHDVGRFQERLRSIREVRLETEDRRVHTSNELGSKSRHLVDNAGGSE